MKEDILIDYHKLHFHPKEVAKWLNGEMIYPICIEISPSGACNHRCIFCSQSYLGYMPNLLDENIVIENLLRLKDKGTKSVVFAGEGEPLLNKSTPKMINSVKEIGIDVAMSTNAVLLTKEKSEECLSSLTWIRISLNACDSETYNKVHGTKNKDDFETVIKNIKDAVNVKRKESLNTTIGVQLVLLPDNYNGVVDFAKLLRDIGVDYFTIKPFSKHPLSLCDVKEFNYTEFESIENELNKLNSAQYRVLARTNSMNRIGKKRLYPNCLGIPFWAYIDSKGEVWPCLAYIGVEGFSFGKLGEKNFIEIWESEKRKTITEKMCSMDISNCRQLCRLDSINEYLFQLKNPGAHINFI
jgi:cyclic pyranopterin phosphate synthase